MTLAGESIASIDPLARRTSTLYDLAGAASPASIRSAAADQHRL